MLRKPLLFFLTAIGLTVPSVMSAFEYEGLDYEVSDWEAGTCYLYTSGGASGDLVIPAHPVDESGREWTLTEIGVNAFKGCSGLTSISLPEGLTSIGSSAFEGCSSLTSISLPEGVTSIGSSAFKGCSGLTSISLPEGVTSIGHWAFEDCSSLTSISLHEGVTSIGEKAFEGCSSLTSISLPEGLTSLGAEVFSRCSSLTSVSLPKGLTLIGNGAFYECSSLTSISIPEGVTSIGDDAFCGCSSLTSISLPEGVTSIGNYAFWGCSSLTSVSIPVGVRSIGEKAFCGCGGLTSVSFPVGLTSIGGNAFENCSGLTSVSLPEGLTSIGYQAFIMCSGLTSVSLPEGLASIGDLAFSYCSSLRLVTIPSSVTSIGYEAFAETGLISIAIPSSVAEVGDNAFAGNKSLKSIFIGAGVQNLKSGSFDSYNHPTKIVYPTHLEEVFSDYGASFKIPYEESAYEDFKVAEDGAVYSADGTTLIYVPSAYSGAFSIPAGVTTIGAYAFAGCNEITSIDIPASVTYVGENAFVADLNNYELSNIPRVNFADWSAWMANVKMENIGSNPYRNGNAAYAGGIPVNIVAWPEGMTEIPDYVLAGIKFNDEVVLPYNLRKIGAYAFFNQKEIYAAELPATLEEIGEGAFKGCELLENPVFPAGLQSIGSYAYSGCLSLTEIDLPEGLTSLGDGVFAGDTALEKAALMAGITEVGSHMFEGCSTLWKVYLPAETVSIGDYAFNWCRSLDEITIPATVEHIGVSAFSHCALTKITLPNSLRTLGEYAFYDQQLAEITIGSGLETIPANAFSVNPIRQLNLSEGLKEIGERAFTTNKYYGNKDASIGYLALPSTVESIGENAFAYCDFGELVVNEGIGELASGSLGRPNVLTLPSTVRSIAPGAIDPKGCRLKVLRVKSSNPPALSEALSFSTDINDNLVMIVNAGRKSTYERNARWKQISNIKEDGETEIVVYMTGDYSITEEIRTTSGLMPSVVTKMSVIGPMTVNDLDLVAQNMISLISLDLSAATGINEIPDRLFERSTLKEVILPSTVTRIGNRAFADCIMLSMSELPAAVTEIGSEAFSNSPRISLSALPEMLETIGDRAFSNCHGLRNLTFGQALTSVGYSAFSGCSMLETADFTQSAISSVPDEAFSGCSMLDEVLLPETVETIGSYAFRGTDVRDIEFAAAVTNIGSYAFADCRRLVSANIPEGVAEAAEYIFASCPRLVSASFPVGVTTVGANIFDNDKRLATLSSASSVAPRAVRGAFDNIRTRYISLTVPYNAFRAYLNAAQWGSFETIKAGLPVVIPMQVEVSAILEEDYQELLREDYLEEQTESAAAEEEIPTPAERVAAGARAVRRAAQRATANEGRSFARLFDGAGLNTGAGTRIFINPKEGETLLSVLVGGEEMIDQMEGNSLFIPASAAGSIEIRTSGVEVGVDKVVADGEIDYNAPYEVYDIKGACVGNSVDRLASGIYIIRQGGVAKKIAVK